jgi:hypothetical protein
MSAPGAWNRVALPLALSLGGHAVLVAVCLWAPLCGPPERQARAEGQGSGGPFTLQFVQVREGPREPLESDGGWDDVSVGRAPVLDPPKGGAHGDTPPAPASKDGPRGGAPGGPGGGAGLLAAGAQARRVVYLIDCSVSMGPSGAFERARAEVLASLRSLPPEARFQVVAYTRTARPLVGRPLELLPATPDVIDQVAEALQGCHPTGLTDHVLAVRTALAYRPDLLFLLTDADDLRPAAARELHWLPTDSTTVHVIELAGGAGLEGQGPLALFAARTGGHYRRVRPE